MNVAEKLRTIIEELSAQYLEREVTITNAVLALLSRQHHFVTGPIGAAKSAVHEAVVARIDGANFFATQMHDAMKTDELFGQIDMPRYDRENVWVRNTDGYLPWAHLAMVDEIDKGQHLLRSLLRVANERKWRNGHAEVDLPLITMVASANQALGEDMVAVWDRFLIRENVTYIEEAANFRTMLTGGGRLEEPTTITLAELQAASQLAVPSISVPDDVLDGLWDLRTDLRNLGVVASDRRWKDSLRLLQARAFLMGRAAVGTEDLDVLVHVMWSSPEQINKVIQALMPHVDATTRQVNQVLAGLHDLRAQVDALNGMSQQHRIAQAADFSEKLARHRETLRSFAKQSNTSPWHGAQRAWIGTKIAVNVTCAGMDSNKAADAAHRAWNA